MKTKYKYIEFCAQPGSSPSWLCINRKHSDQLGAVVYSNGWRQYIYEPTVQAIYSASCLRDIAEFLKACGVEEV